MPRPTLPPTPASSTDIKGKDGGQTLGQLQLSFELPPPAIAQDPSQVSPSDTHTSPKSYPMQASEAVKARRRASSTAQKPASDAFALPPPPTRSRKIIQMKPRPSQQDDVADAPEAGPSSSAKATSVAGKGPVTTPASKEPAAKKKQPSATSAAGRKIARKTAHSLIERRRRSKMNEEFAVLKDMIPACTGEMHKLAILQASIEYVRYLEDCVTKLKAQRDVALEAAPTDSGLQTPSGRDPWGSIPQFHPSYQQDPDVEMTGSEAPSPTFTAEPSHQPSVSPALLSEDARNRHNSYSSASTDQRHYSYSSATTSPAFGPQSYNYGRGGPSLPPSALTSPALVPLREHRDLDQEATAALLMLNSDRRGSLVGGHSGHQSDRSNSTGSASTPQPSQGTGRGMSVRDLLST
ncbi:hypothetical protein F5X68DRAFT_155832 [Plectosphaerella plurivora]|uniref:BHLH domain-containing protein n=1 Tax=Plectosphaerella plurivora TaxID=936078 RepID=A0A9P8V7U3_9PEZI|nr:hypothetical protein F5X68DRAFT_155832 [Plectosphaerella plurivora]